MTVAGDQQPAAGRMQMVWMKRRTRPAPALTRFPFELAQGEDEEAGKQAPASSAAPRDGGDEPVPRIEDRTVAPANGTGVRESVVDENAQLAEQMHKDGNCLAEEGRFGEALGKWETAIFLTPGKAVLHEQKAQVLLEIGKSWSAVQAATCATELQPNWADAWVTLARAQLNYGEPCLAVDSAQTALRLEPDHKEANVELDRAQFLAIRQRQAIRESTGNASAADLLSGSHTSTPSLRRARVYDSRDVSFGTEHRQIVDREEDLRETREADGFDKYDDDTYDWVDELRRPAPQITTENLMSDFSDIL